MLNEMGINVVESEEAEDERTRTAAADAADEEEAEGGELVEAAPARAVAGPRRAEPTDRTDDPVRMYLREMGSVELLSREGEIAIAKRIEAGREAMIAGLCESPLTFQAIIIWRDELNDGKILLRDIIDLEATYAGPDGKDAPEAVDGATGGRGRRRRAAPRRRRAPSGDEPPIRRGRPRRGRHGEQRVAVGHGGRAEAEGARDLRPHRRRLQEAAPPAGPERREPSCRTRRSRPPRSASTRS